MGHGMKWSPEEAVKNGLNLDSKNSWNVGFLWSLGLLQNSKEVI